MDMTKKEPSCPRTRTRSHNRGGCTCRGLLQALDLATWLSAVIYRTLVRRAHLKAVLG
jgi:hypothetical protein